jgi:hypothetical protein
VTESERRDPDPAGAAMVTQGVLPDSVPETAFPVPSPPPSPASFIFSNQGNLLLPGERLGSAWHRTHRRDLSTPPQSPAPRGPSDSVEMTAAGGVAEQPR